MNIIEEIKNAGAKVEYRGYYYRISHVIEILLLGLLCKMQTLKDIHFWANTTQTREMLKTKFKIMKIPCYSHFTNLVGIINGDKLNEIFMDFFGKLVEDLTGKVVSFDGKTVCSTANMADYSSPLHIASAFVVENGITIGQLATDDKSNEIPAVQELIQILNLTGATVMADALNCQKNTVKKILTSGADYVLAVKKNQPNLYIDIAEEIEFKLTDEVEKSESPLQKYTKVEKGHGRIEKRTAYITDDVEWLKDRDNWDGLQSIGAVVSKSETRYYISSRKLSAEELLEITRAEWAVESMHWQLDVLFNEDRTALHEKSAQLTMNILRKSALNVIRGYRDKFKPKLSLADIMRHCLFDSDFLLILLSSF